MTAAPPHQSPPSAAGFRPADHHMVDLFAGPGGLDVAAAWLGIAAEGVEWADNAYATRLANGLDGRQGDVRDFSPADFARATVLAGGPPCQTYTVAGSGVGRRALDRVLSYVKAMGRDGVTAELLDEVGELDDYRTGLVLEPLRWAILAKEAGSPYRAIVLEQVPQALPVWAAMGEVLEGLGYQAVTGVLHTEEYGIPQSRRRAVLVARLKDAGGADIALPEPTHQRYRKGVARNPAGARPVGWKTLGETLNLGVGHTVRSNYGTGGDPAKRGLRDHSVPSATITGKFNRNRIVGPDGGSINMAIPQGSRLQTFPPDYRWAGRDRAQQVGNAVPPRLGVHLIAAALGYEVDATALDQVVAMTWSRARQGALAAAVRPIRRPVHPPSSDGLTLFEG